jgi:hypothetical protein
MPNETALSLRLPSTFIERVDALLPYLELKLKGQSVTRAAAIREALARGIEELEEEQAVRRHLEQSIADELRKGSSILDVAKRHKDDGIRVADVEKVAKEVSVAPPAKSLKRRR